MEETVQQELDFGSENEDFENNFLEETDDVSEEQYLEEEAKPKPKKQKEIPERKTTIMLDGNNQLEVSEAMLKKFYGINDKEPLTEREWKTALAAYKAHKKADINTEKYKRNDKLMYEFVEMLQNNPAELLKRAGHDPRKFSEKFLGEILEEELMPEEQRRALQLQREKEELERQLNEQRTREEQARHDYMTQQYQQKYTQDIINALEEDKSIPKTQDVIRRIGYYMMRATQKGIEVPIKRMVQLVKNDITKMTQEIFDNLPDSAIEEFFGNERLKRIRKLEIQKIKTRQPMYDNSEPVKKSTGSEKKFLTKEEWREMINRRARL